MKKGILIAGYAGIGKTTLAKKYKNVIDLESSTFKYNYSEEEKSLSEKKKGLDNRKFNCDFPNNYYKAIEDAILKYDFILIQGHPRYFDYLDSKKIEFWVVYPEKETLEKAYKERFVNRGNNEEYIDKVINGFEAMLAGFEKSKSKKIVLEGDETLEDYLLRQNYTLVEK